MVGFICADLLSQFEEYIPFAFFDRTFYSLEQIAKYQFGVWSKVLLRLLLPSEELRSIVPSYLNGNCYKLIANDFQDQVIPNPSSLQQGVAKSFNNPLNKQSLRDFYSSIHFIKSKYIQSHPPGINEKAFQLQVQSETFIEKLFEVLGIDAAGWPLYAVNSAEEMCN